MTYIIADRVQQTTATTGTGTITLLAISTQYQSFASGIGIGNTCDYCLLSGNGVDWEVGNGTVGATTLSRDTVYASSNGGFAINLNGTSVVLVTITANKITAADFDDVETGIIAAGSSQSNATPLTKRQNYVSTSVDGIKGVRIDSALMIPGNHIYITNEDLSNTLACYPPTGASFNNQSVDSPIYGGIYADSTAHIIAKSATVLRTVP